MCVCADHGMTIRNRNEHKNSMVKWRLLLSPCFPPIWLFVLILRQRPYRNSIIIKMMIGYELGDWSIAEELYPSFGS